MSLGLRVINNVKWAELSNLPKIFGKVVNFKTGFGNHFSLEFQRFIY